VFDLANGGPKQGLRHLAHLKGTRVLVCGGDGTACWLNSAMDEMFGAQNVATRPVT